MNVFVTGATGAIGSCTVRALVAAGHQVWGLTSKATNAAAVEKLGAKAVVGDMRDANAFREVAGAADAVLHAAAAFPDKVRYSAADVDSFMGADAAAVDALLSVLGPQCRAFVLSSGVWSYGDTGPKPVDETHTTANHHLLMRQKIEIEKKVLANRVGMVARIGVVYGPGSLWGKLYLDAMKKKQRAMMPGSGQNIVSMVHADDVGAAFCFLAEHPAPGEVFNIADDEPAPLGDVVRAQAAALGAPPPRSIPAFVVRLAAGKYSGGPPTAHAAVTNQKLRSRGFQLKYPSYREGVVAVAKAVS